MRIDARRLVALGATALLAASLAACGGGETSQALSAQTQAVLTSTAPASTAAVELIDASATLSQTGSTAWTLAKTGALNGSTVTNFGNGPATIGNIVINLQKRINNKWVTRSSNVADATNGDAATTANIHKAASSEGFASFTENSASGSLNFMDATNNTIFSLVPQVMIGAGQTRALLFSAEFDNNDAALQLTSGTQIRTEIIVSFGNATVNGQSTANVDINGNGTIDADEARVRSVPSRLTLTVPAPVNGNGTVTLTDTIDDVTSTGDVTFSNVTFNLGATSGTVTANVAGGTNGGNITNCAHLTGNSQTVNSGGFTFPIVNGVNLQACGTVTVAGSPTCTPGAPGCGWNPGDMNTFPQTGYSDSTTGGGTLLAANFSSLYGSTALVIGGNNTLRFTTAAAVFTYLPATGAPAALTGSLTDPITSSSGELGGQVLVLQLNVDLSGAGVLTGAVDFGSLHICNYTATPQINGQTVDSFLTTANWILGGGSATFGPGTATTIASLLNNAFVNGSPSTFAQTNLFSAPCTN